MRDRLWPHHQSRHDRSAVGGGIYYGLSVALYGAIALEGGAVRTSNFHDYLVVRVPQTPVIETIIVPSKEPQGGRRAIDTNVMFAVRTE